MSMQVRPGNAGDAEPAIAVWKLANEARRDGAPVPAQHETRVRSYLGKPDSFLAIAEAEQGLAGMALGMQGLDDDGAGPPIPGLCHIAMVFVHPDVWGQRVGKQLMQHVLDEGRARGYVRFQLWTHADNERAQRLYEGLGFRRSGREKDDDLGEHIVHYRLEQAT